MQSRRTLTQALIAIVALMIGMAVARAQAPAATTQEAPPVAPGLVYRTVSGTCFQPLATTSGETAYIPGSSGVFVSTSFNTECRIAFPDNVKIVEVIFFVRDNAATNIRLRLSAYEPATGAVQVVQEVLTTGASSDIQAVALSGNPLAAVDNTRFQYTLEAVVGENTSAHALFGARIGVQPSTQFLPLAIN